MEKITNRNEKFKKNLVTRLNRIEGQISGIRKMIEKDSYCDDVLTQISAAQSALDSVSKLLLESHIKICVLDKIHEGDDEIIDELIKTIGKLL